MRIELHALTKKYRVRGRETAALDGISLTIASGELVAVIGRSGSGKSTLLNHLCGLDRADSGQILLDGKDISKAGQDDMAKERRSRIGVIYQFYNLVPELNVRDNITLPVELAGGRIDEDALHAILQTVGLDGREEDFPSALSGGQQQRVAIARALYQQPTLILADEPTGNLDEESSREIMALLQQLHRERGMTMVIVTHSAAVAAQVDRVITLHEGRVIRDERP